MKQNLKDILFISLFVIGLFLLFEISQNGRYQSINDGVSILDTRNGKIYTLERNGNNNPESGPIYKWNINNEEVK